MPTALAFGKNENYVAQSERQLLGARASCPPPEFQIYRQDYFAAAKQGKSAVGVKLLSVCK